MPNNQLKEIHIYGTHQEFIVCNINDKKITGDKECIEDIFDDIEEMDNVVHLFGANLEDVYLEHKNEQILDLKKWVINYEPCYETVSKRILIEDLQNTFEECGNYEEVAEQILQSDFFKPKPSGKRFLIQSYNWRGYCSTFEFKQTIDKNDITLVSIELEGMDYIVANILVGLLIKNGTHYAFKNIDYGESFGWGKGSHAQLYEKNKGITWES